MSNYIDRISLNGITKIIRDTTLESKQAAENGTDVSLVTTGEKYSWNQGSSTKADKVSGAINGNFAGLDANGNLTDSGHKHSDYITDVQLNGTSAVSSGVANIPIGQWDVLGLVRPNPDYGTGITTTTGTSAGTLCVSKATDANVKAGSNTYKPIVPYNQHQAVFYGLAKAAGDTTQKNSDNAVGTYTDDAKTAIRTMIGAGTYTKPSTGIPSSDLASGVVPVTDVQINSTSILSSGVANIPIASDTTFGVLKVSYSDGFTVSANGFLGLRRATGNTLKTGNDGYAVITSYFQHEAVFYGLAKASGDTTQAESDNAVGTYTSDAKASIREMIGAGTYSMPTGGIPSTDLASAVTSAIASKMEASLKGANNGVAELDSSGKVPSSQLPSFVDDVVEYNGSSNFPSTGETGKIYVDTSTNITYRWGGSSYVPIGSDLALGETSTTAYRGDRGKTAYDHASDSGKVTSGYSSGLYKIAVTAEGHIASVTEVVKADITNLGIPGSNAVTDVQLGGTSIVSSGIANIPATGASQNGYCRIDSAYGVNANSYGRLYISKASDAYVKAGTNQYQPIVPYNQHTSVFYGLAKAAGEDMASSENAVGTYTDNAKSAIRTMIGAGTYSKPVGGIPASDLAADAISTMDISVIAAEYDDEEDYSTNDYCTYDGKLYKANTNVSTETWDSTHWDETTVMEEIIARCSIIPAAGVSF